MHESQDELCRRPTLRRLVIAFAITTAILLAAVVFLYAKVRELQNFRKNFAFTMFSLGYERDEDLVTPQVGTIQFLKRGYSVEFDTVEYTSNGLVLKGRIGNPLNIWVSSLTLRFDARPPISSLADKWYQAHKWGWNDAWNIGSAQTSVGILAPKMTAPFQNSAIVSVYGIFSSNRARNRQKEILRRRLLNPQYKWRTFKSLCLSIRQDENTTKELLIELGAHASTKSKDVWTLVD
jgi:hypothetical protein